MEWFNHIDASGIYENPTTQCFEAWIVGEDANNKRLVASCSMSVPPEQYRWWVHKVNLDMKSN